MSDADKLFTERAVQVCRERPLAGGEGVKELLQRHLAETDILNMIRASDRDRLQHRLRQKLAQTDRQTKSTADKHSVNFTTFVLNFKSDK